MPQKGERRGSYRHNEHSTDASQGGDHRGEKGDSVPRKVVKRESGSTFGHFPRRRRGRRDRLHILVTKHEQVLDSGKGEGGRSRSRIKNQKQRELKGFQTLGNRGRGSIVKDLGMKIGTVSSPIS